MRDHADKPKPARRGTPSIGASVAAAAARSSAAASPLPLRLALAPGAARVQAKLVVGQPGDPFEREAEAVAEQVMRMPEPAAAVTPIRAGETGSEPEIQRLAGDRDPFLEDAVVAEGGDGEQVQTLRPAGQAGGAHAISAAALNGGAGGAPVEARAKSFMEARFGADFSGVQIHADRRAAELSRSISARAFTHGRHIYFNEGEYRPDTPEGKHVLAHELTHVIQQGAGASPAVQRMSDRGEALRHNVTPWPPGGPIGSDYKVATDAGSVTTGWGAYAPVQYHLSYWCHGHTLGTFYDFGYSLYSGTPIRTAIQDEWSSVPADQTVAGDIAVWTADWGHSARFTSPVVTNGLLDPARSMLSTKNGSNPVAVRSLNQIMATYGTAGVAVFRHK